MIEHGLDLAQKRAAGVINLKPDQVGVVIFIVGKMRKLIAFGIKPGAAQGIGGLFVVHARQTRAEPVLELPGQGDFK